jgi:predicted ribosomally synthesized peptide with SipW-like signal peptide
LKGRKRTERERRKLNMNKKILLGIMTIGLVSMLAGAGLYAYFSDTETSVGNVFTAGTIDISIDPTVGQPVTLNGFVDLKPCQTGYTTTKITNVGPNSATLWKHVTNVENREHGITDAEDKYYAVNPASENWLISNWIHYDMFVYKPLGYSFSTTIDIEGSDYDLEVTVEDGDGWLTWTFDFPVEHFTGDGNLNVGLIIALDGDGNGPAYQIHNNDGATADYPHGMWLYSPWGPTISDGWNGWHSGDTNTPVTDLDWVEASGDRKGQGTDGILQIKIKKCELGETIHWAASPTVGSGFYAPVYDDSMQLPTGFSWATPIVTMTIPNYIEAPIMTLIKEIPEAEGWDLTGADGVASKWILLGTLEPGECMWVIQSYHLDATVDNWGQSDRVFFDIEFLAQQTEGNPPPPGPVLPGHG